MINAASPCRSSSSHRPLLSLCLPPASDEVFAQTGNPDGRTRCNRERRVSIAPTLRPFRPGFRGSRFNRELCGALDVLGARKLKQSPVLGELAVGIIVGTILYQFGGPTVTIIRHYDIIQHTTEKALTEGKNWHDDSSILAGAVRSVKRGCRKSRACVPEQGLSRQSFIGQIDPALRQLWGRNASFHGRAGSQPEGVKGYRRQRVGGRRDRGQRDFHPELFHDIAAPAQSSRILPPLFAGAAFCASSIGITARIFRDMNSLRYDRSQDSAWCRRHG